MKARIYSLLSIILSAGLFAGCSNNSDALFKPVRESVLRAPAYPLVTIDPYTSAWSFTDKLNEDVVRHWTGKPYPLTGALRVDGKTYRFMGIEDQPLNVLLKTANLEKWDAVYTEQKPKEDWTACDYIDSSWKRGKAAFGTPDMGNLSTEWTSPDIWIRRTFELSDDYSAATVFLEYSHDDIFELFINGIQVVKTGYVWKNNVLHELSAEVRATLKSGKNIIAAHCHNRTRGGYVDFGLLERAHTTPALGTPAVQKSVRITPTQTYYTFECGNVELNLIFTSPLLMDDLDLMSTPINYISYQVKSLDRKAHDVQIYMDAGTQWATNVSGQETETTLYNGEDKLIYAKTGTREQPILLKKRG
ncbi:hypothetical protein EZS27_013943 [termite gut metagenome]|uniref:Beta-galactosidase n=1 Tax=termite gut metagenome TaxID=433724 RepID=A0A5J4RWB2_9ZZZZ